MEDSRFKVLFRALKVLHGSYLQYNDVMLVMHSETTILAKAIEWRPPTIQSTYSLLCVFFTVFVSAMYSYKSKNDNLIFKVIKKISYYLPNINSCTSNNGDNDTITMIMTDALKLIFPKS